MNPASPPAGSLEPTLTKESGRLKSFDPEGIYKLPRSVRYFNVSVLWIAYYPHLTRALYALRIRHEVVTLISLGCGLLGAAILSSAHTTVGLILCALMVHLKDAFDACDGALARVTGTGHRIGRFLDTIGDGVVFTALIAAVAWNDLDQGHSAIGTAVWAGLTWLSLFLQCSYFNFYHLQYAQLVGADSVSRLDERTTADDADRQRSRPARILLGWLQHVYLWWFGWQDHLIRSLDRFSRPPAIHNQPVNDSDSGRWYGARGFLTANSALCYGTHAFVLILCLIAGRPFWFFPVVVIGMNLYWAAILLSRWIIFRRVA